MKTHHLTIAGHRITVRSPAPTAQVDHLAQLLDERIRAVGTAAGPVSAVLVAALGLAGELEQTQTRLDEMRARVHTQSEALLAEVRAIMAADGR